jgi:CheY-like chemotaxis protein
LSAPTCVLVVDDDTSIRDLMALALSDAGYEVSEADDGAAALALVRKSPPDVILLDMRMPIMDGWEFAQAYRQLPGPHAPVIVVTAASDPAERAAEIKADGYLAKPFRLDELYTCVEQYASRRGAVPAEGDTDDMPVSGGTQ